MRRCSACGMGLVDADELASLLETYSVAGVSIAAIQPSDDGSRFGTGRAPPAVI